MISLKCVVQCVRLYLQIYLIYAIYANQKFCNQCHLFINSKNSYCHICHKESPEYSKEESIYKIQTMKFRCVNFESGCNKTFSFPDLLEHQHICDRNSSNSHSLDIVLQANNEYYLEISKCPECLQFVFSQNYNSHKTDECLTHSITCLSCLKVIFLKNYLDHFNLCDKINRKCNFCKRFLPLEHECYQQIILTLKALYIQSLKFDPPEFFIKELGLIKEKDPLLFNFSEVVTKFILQKNGIIRLTKFVKSFFPNFADTIYQNLISILESFDMTNYEFDKGYSYSFKIRELLNLSFSDYYIEEMQLLIDRIESFLISYMTNLENKKLIILRMIQNKSNISITEGTSKKNCPEKMNDSQKHLLDKSILLINLFESVNNKFIQAFQSFEQLYQKNENKFNKNFCQDIKETIYSFINLFKKMFPEKFVNQNYELKSIENALSDSSNLFINISDLKPAINSNIVCKNNESDQKLQKILLDNENNENTKNINTNESNSINFKKESNLNTKLNESCKLNFTCFVQEVANSFVRSYNAKNLFKEILDAILRMTEEAIQQYNSIFSISFSENQLIEKSNNMPEPKIKDDLLNLNLLFYVENLFYKNMIHVLNIKTNVCDRYDFNLNSKTYVDVEFHRNSFFCCGGTNEIDRVYIFMNSCTIINLQNKSTDLSTSLNEKKTQLSLVSTGFILFCLGGFSGENVKTCEYFDFKANKWKISSPLNEPSKGIISVFMGPNSIYSFGNDSKKIEFLDISSIGNKWIVISTTTNCFRHNGCGLKYGKNLILIFGGISTCSNFILYNTSENKEIILEQKFISNEAFRSTRPILKKDTIYIANYPKKKTVKISCGDLSYLETPLNF